MPFKPEDFPIFDNIDDDFMNDKLRDTIERINQVFESQQIIDTGSITFDRDIMIEIISRIEKRRVYFHIFHNKTKMGELNEAALLTFWIMKLMPFRIKSTPTPTLPPTPTVIINLKLAYALLLGAIAYYAKKENKKINFNNPKLEKHLLYALNYRDLSKEAIMAIAESLIIN